MSLKQPSHEMDGSRLVAESYDREFSGMLLHDKKSVLQNAD